MLSLLKICFFLLFLVKTAHSGEPPLFQKFEIVEINFQKFKENSKPSPYIHKNKKEVKYALVVSGSNYNKSSKTAVVVPVVLKKEKDYKGKFVHSFKSGGKTYIVFTDKMRTINKNMASKTSISLGHLEKEEVRKLLHDILT